MNVPESSIKSVRDGGGAPAAEKQVDKWWKEEDPGPAMVQAAKRIEDSPHERGRRRACLTFARLHSGRPLSSIYDYGSAFRSPYVVDPSGFGWKLPLNVVQAVIEAICAKLAKNKPRSTVLTEGGNWTLQRQAKELTQYLDGLNRANNLYKIGRQVFRDAGTFGTGLFSLYEDRQKATIGVDRTLSIEMIVDDIEASRGKPQTEFRKVPVYRGVLLDKFAKGDPDSPVGKLIMHAKGYNPAGNDGRASEMIPTYEGWHLGDSHVIGIEGATLFKEEWEFDWFPKVAMHWRQPDTGVWGLGAAENLLGVQYEINQMLGRFQANMKLGAKLWVFRQPGGPQKAHMSNEAMTIIDSEVPPTFATPNPMPAQAYQYLWDIYAKAFEIEGVSQLAATGVKPAGLDAAVAMREYNDIQAERFVLMGQDWEDVQLEIDEKQIALSKRMYKRGKSIIVRAPGSKFIRQIDFAKVDMEENRYTLAKFPTSSLPTTPAAKMQTIKEWFESGLIADRETALELLDFPDLQGALNLELAAIEDIKRILEKIVDEGKYEPPEPYMDLARALKMTQSAFLRARCDGVPEKHRDYLLRFIDEVKELQDDMQPPPAAAPVTAPPGQPLPTTAATVPDAAGVPTMALPAGLSSAAVPTELPA